MEAAALGGKTLGVNYHLHSDEIWFQILPKFYKEKGGSSDQARDSICLDKRGIAQLEDGKITFSRRQALSLVMGVYDPLGLVGPALLQGKLLLRRLYTSAPKSTWDSDIPMGEKRHWAGWFRELLQSSAVTFPRSTRAAKGVGPPRLVGFGDASEVAMCAVVYVIWQDSSGASHPRILFAKCRVAPLLGMTVPRGELQALLILHRLLLSATENFPHRFGSISAFTDSQCSIGALEKKGNTMHPYFENRAS